MLVFNPSEWINLVLRWTHVFAAILWVGTTYYFTWLDVQLRRSERAGGSVWMVHSGGFYTVVKQKTSGVLPSDVHWFRWEALATWVSGLMLLGVVYYAGGLLVDASNPSVSENVGKPLVSACSSWDGSSTTSSCARRWSARGGLRRGRAGSDRCAGVWTRSRHESGQPTFTSARYSARSWRRTFGCAFSRHNAG